jgi:hypothetical protein
VSSWKSVGTTIDRCQPQGTPPSSWQTDSPPISRSRRAAQRSIGNGPSVWSKEQPAVYPALNSAAPTFGPRSSSCINLHHFAGASLSCHHKILTQKCQHSDSSGTLHRAQKFGSRTLRCRFTTVHGWMRRRDMTVIVVELAQGYGLPFAYIR